jgi:hypothetical protein
MKKVIHCKTQEEFNKVLGIFEQKGWVWRSGKSPLKGKDNWRENNNETCIEYWNGFLYCCKDYYLNDGYEIISFEEFLELEGNRVFYKKTSINIPEGYKVDEEKSVLEKGKIVFKRTVPSYEEIEEKITENTQYYLVGRQNKEQIQSITELLKLCNVAKYLNGDWIPKIGETHWFISKRKLSSYQDTEDLFINKHNSVIYGTPYFKSEQAAKEAIEILGEDSVRKALTLNF